MENFSNQIEYAKSEIENLLKDSVIISKDIELLSDLTFEEVLGLSKSNNEKNRYLYLIYINPYLICNDEKYMDIDIIAKLLINRFNSEMIEVNNKYQNGEINKIECYNIKTFYKKLYFKSSMTGKDIMRNYYDDIIDNLQMPKRTETSKRLLKKRG